jgi:predicted PurR-regulated permease PerM
MDIATQIIIFIVALLVSAGFLTLVIVLVPAIRELKELLIDLQKTSAEVRGLAEEMRKISSDVEGKLVGFNSMLSNSQKIATNVSSALKIFNSTVFKKAEWLALVPAILWGWKAISKLKRRKNERQ